MWWLPALRLRPVCRRKAFSLAACAGQRRQLRAGWSWPPQSVKAFYIPPSSCPPAPSRLAKRAVLHSRTARFAEPNRPFCMAKTPLISTYWCSDGYVARLGRAETLIFVLHSLSVCLRGRTCGRVVAEPMPRRALAPNSLGLHLVSCPCLAASGKAGRRQECKRSRRAYKNIRKNRTLRWMPDLGLTHPKSC